MNIQKITFAVAFLALVSAAVFTAPVILADTCVSVYGYGFSCQPSVNISINKSVQNPQNGNFVDNLGTNDPKYIADQTVTFRIVVTNTGNQNIGKVTVKDVFPQFISFVSGPGTFDNSTKVLSFEMLNLAAGESRTVTVQGKVVAENQLPSDIGIACITNQAVATADNGNSTSDNAQLCVEKKVLGTTNVVVFPVNPVTTIPATGPEYFLGFIPAGLLGLFLRKKAVR